MNILLENPPTEVDGPKYRNKFLISNLTFKTLKPAIPEPILL